MSELAHIAALIFKRAAGRDRILVAIAGPPGSGKSTLAEALCDALVAGGQSAAVVAMDGFHFDDRVLEARGLRARKGAPETFDAGGLAHLLRRLREREADVAVPVFDRSIEIARAGGAVIASDARIVLVEGNYLLLDEEPWSAMAPLFDMSIYLDVPAGELEERLVRRWLDHGLPDEQARARAQGNDIPNARRVVERRRKADIVLD